MRKFLKYGHILTMALLFSACDNADTVSTTAEHVGMHHSANSFDSDKVKTAEPDRTCFYKDNPPPLSTKTETNNEYLDMQYIAFRVLPNGATQRVVANAGLQRALDQAEQNNQFDEWVKLLANGTRFVNMNPDEAVLSVGQRLARNPDPLDFKVSWYSKIAFVVIGQDVRFNTSDPFRIASGGMRSPFYGPADFQRNNQMIVVDYLSLPNHGTYGFDTIEPRDCIYIYELNLMANRNVSVRDEEVVFTSQIIIDPGGESNGGPDNDIPPSGGWP